MKFSRRTAGYNLFDHIRNKEILQELKAELVDKESKKKQIKLATTCNKNVQEQDGINNAEL
jgi:hypothetical protein